MRKPEGEVLGRATIAAGAHKTNHVIEGGEEKASSNVLFSALKICQGVLKTVIQYHLLFKRKNPHCFQER